MMTPADKRVTGIRARLERATPDWTVGIVTDKSGQGFAFSASGPLHWFGETPSTEKRNAAYTKARAQCDFMTHALPDLEFLLTERERLMRVIGEMEKGLGELARVPDIDYHGTRRSVIRDTLARVKKMREGK